LDRARGIAETALREQRNFLTMISHEFRTPLGIINVSASIIEQHTTEADQLLRAETDRIRRSSRRLSDLVEECLHEDFLTNAATAIRADRMGLRTVLENLATEYGVKFRAFTDDAPIISADAHLLPVALSCAVANACKYGRRQDAVELHLHATVEADQERTVVIDVCDDGPGIPDDDRQRVFERYYRAAHGARKPGSGLGLFLARRIID
ncbi:MAG: ATP-binding protein, partial [Clostridia bacterium]|nr:ATP-binding protein [Clostridia bacterium]